MKRRLEKRSDDSGTLSRTIVTSLLMAVLPALTIAGEVDETLRQAGESFQYSALFNPSESQLRAEERGRVMIYSGLDEAVVEKALDEQFERIDHMMFVNIKRKEPAVQVSSYDDDC